jgi:hypothetical protein
LEVRLQPQVKHRLSIWAWIGICSLIVVLILLVVGEVMIRRAGPILKDRIEETLRARFNSRVELDSMNVSLLRGIEVSGSHLRIYPPDDVVAAAKQPLIAVDSFSFHSGLTGLFIEPMHVGRVQLTGLDINVPPREMRQHIPEGNEKQKGKIRIVVDEVVCDKSRLIVGTSKPDKDPLDFELEHVELHNVGPDTPWKYDAVLINSIPRGDIHAIGAFGPWRTDSPGDSFVSGHYTFAHADLNPIKGIGGMLSSVGEFRGQLNKIVVDGTTETPDFSLDTANKKMPLHTDFHAVVDGTSGDTYLQPVHAKLANSAFTASGKVINIKGRGHRIDLDVDVPDAQLRDFLELAVNTRPAAMTGRISAKMNLQIPPGKESVPQKLRLGGGFMVRGIHFTDPQVQDKVDMLSVRAQGDPKDAKPGAPDVISRIKGNLQMGSGVLRFKDLEYFLPGGQVNLDGIYSLDGQRFDFHGKLLTDASLSHLVASPWKSLLLKTVSPFFRRQGGGAEIPVSISGTRSEPKFGLDVFRHRAKDNDPDAEREVDSAPASRNSTPRDSR